MSLDRDTELRRLAQLLHVQTEALDYLQPLDGTELQALRQAFQSLLLDDHGPTFAKMAAGGKIAPDALSAMLCKKVFGPTLTANMSYYTPAAKAAKMCSHFDAHFMAEIAREQMPDRAEELLRDLPTDLMRGATRELLANGDYHILGGFTDYMPEDKVAALMHEITDMADNLRVSRFCQRKDRIAKLTAGMSDEMLSELLKTANDNEEFLLEVGLVTAEMDATMQKRAAEMADQAAPGLREKMKPVAEKHQLGAALRVYFETE